MKYKYLLIFIFFVQIAFGQNITETRTALLTNGDYSLEGTVYLELFDNDSLQLRFDTNYLTQSNVFDVHVFLTNNNNYAKPIDTTGMLLVANIGSIDGLNYSSGAMTFNLPTGVGINDYQHIVFICIQFGQLHWGNGEFDESILTSTIAIEEAINITVSLYPNPSKSGKIRIQFLYPQKNTLIEVLNINGQIISRERILRKKKHFVQLKDPGTYFLRLSSEESSTIKKMIRL